MPPYDEPRCDRFHSTAPQSYQTCIDASPTLTVNYPSQNLLKSA